MSDNINMIEKQQRRWKAVIYIRISNENGEDMLENQQNVVTEYLNMLGNIEVCSIKIDDGYSGLNSDRPAFQELLCEIQQGKFDCVAVRDLSRLSRNHIEAGRYIQDVFPQLGMRFISVFEGFDFTKAPEYNIAVMVGFRNLVNEEYSRNLSQRVKVGLSQGYKDGRFLGAFAAYGYKKSLYDRHKLEPDHIPAKVVQNIFQWKLEGMSAAAIAELLEQTNVLSPAEYKKDSNFRTSFKKNTQAKWTPKAVGRILANRIYTGCLEQGKSIKPYFKANSRVQKPPDEWTCVKNAHEAIVSIEQFEAVSRLLKMDTRKTPGEKAVPALAGFIRCKNCGQNMILKQDSSKNRIYQYYVCCGKNEENKSCSGYRIPKTVLEEESFCQLHSHMDNVMKINELLPSLDVFQINKFRKREIGKELIRLADELELNRNYLNGLYGEFAIQVISKTDIEFMRQHYMQKCGRIDENIRTLEMSLIDKTCAGTIFNWIEQYKPFFSFEKITRPMLAYLVQRITVHDNKQAKVEFLYEREFKLVQGVFSDCQKEKMP